MTELWTLLQLFVLEDRPCLGALLGRKCRDTNAEVRDGRLLGRESLYSTAKVQHLSLAAGSSHADKLAGRHQPTP